MKLLAVLSFLMVLSCGLCGPTNLNSTTSLLDEYLSAFSDALDGISENNTQASMKPDDLKQDFKVAVKIDYLLRKSAQVLIQSPLIRHYVQWVQKRRSNMVLLPTLVKNQLEYSSAGEMFNEVVTEMKNRPTAAKLWQEIYAQKTSKDLQTNIDKMAVSRVRRSLLPPTTTGFLPTLGKYTSTVLQYKVKAIDTVSDFVVKYLQRGINALG